ncbi:MAG: hypothetical protein KUG73_00760 [Pseudomonadales bacterium]|nr:hypothetical protein [Pseudomonadales bacterium]
MIRQAELKDHPIIELFDLFSGGREEEIMEKRLVVFTQEDLVCGFISMARAGILDRPYIQYLAVSPNSQRI